MNMKKTPKEMGKEEKKETGPRLREPMKPDTLKALNVFDSMACGSASQDWSSGLRHKPLPERRITKAGGGINPGVSVFDYRKVGALDEVTGGATLMESGGYTVEFFPDKDKVRVVVSDSIDGSLVADEICPCGDDSMVLLSGGDVLSLRGLAIVGSDIMVNMSIDNDQ